MFCVTSYKSFDYFLYKLENYFPYKCHAPCVRVYCWSNDYAAGSLLVGIPLYPDPFEGLGIIN